MKIRRSAWLAAVVGLLAALALSISATTPARADRCDDLANQLKNQIDGVGVGKTAANMIYLSHPRPRRSHWAAPAAPTATSYSPNPRAANPRRPFSSSWPAPPRSPSRYRKTTCSKEAPAASSGWVSFVVTMSLPATAAWTCGARERKPTRRSRLPAPRIDRSAVAALMRGCNRCNFRQ